MSTDDAIRIVCDHLAERTAELFLGAGVNDGLVDEVGHPFPLGRALSDRLLNDLLDTPGTGRPLADVADIARHKFGAAAVNTFLAETFRPFRPGTAHRALVQLPWDVIYTTNYDTLVEAAGLADPSQSAGIITPVFTSTESVSALTEQDIPYFKLHGCIEHANSDEGRLVLTRDDYRHYARHRRGLFRRLKRDLMARTFLFIGYSLQDEDFRHILDDCREELGATALPLGHAVVSGIAPVDATYWREKYNIQLVNSDAAQFLLALRDTWRAENRSVVPPSVRRDRFCISPDSTASFGRVGCSYYHVRPADCSGPSDAHAFFSGASPTWAIIRDGVAPKRSAYDELFEAVFPDFEHPEAVPREYLVLGAAGTGKTTLIRQLLWDLASQSTALCFEHIANTPLDAVPLLPFVNPAQPQRVFVFIPSAASYRTELRTFLAELRRRNLPVTLLLEERANQWHTSASFGRSPETDDVIELGSLDQREIGTILDALTKHGYLGRIAGLDRSEQEAHFTRLAHHELLVALRELTAINDFDRIIANEFDRIPSDKGKQAYVYVAALGQIDLPLRYEVLLRLVKVNWTELGSLILTPTQGVLIDCEESGSSRHDVGFQLRTRHPIIGSVIFNRAASDDDSKYSTLCHIVSELDPSFPEDKRVLRQLVVNRALSSCIASGELRRRLFDNVAQLLPKEAWVAQQRSGLERDLGNTSEAIRFAKLAVSQDPGNAACQNTLGMAYELAARSEMSHEQRKMMLAEATRLFENDIRRDASNPYGYIGLALVLRQKRQDEIEPADQASLWAQEVSLLETGLDTTGHHPIVASALAERKTALGDRNDAIGLLRRGLDAAKRPSPRLVEQLAQLLFESGSIDDARRAVEDGLRADPTSWRLHRLLGRICVSKGDQIEAVETAFRRAIAYRQDDFELKVELGATLFMNGRQSDGEALFHEANVAWDSVERNRRRPGDRRRVVVRWLDDQGRRRVFEGVVVALAGRGGFVRAKREGFEAYFATPGLHAGGIRVGASVRFVVGFNARGPVADLQ